MAEVWPWVEEQLKKNRVGAVVGTSNGAVAATEVALHLRARAKERRVPLVLMSGLPAEEQSLPLKDAYRAQEGSILMTVASRESHFGGIPNFYWYAGYFFADVKTFDGSHGQEPPALAEKIGRNVARQLLSDVVSSRLVEA